MLDRRLAALAILPALLGACVTASTTRTTWVDPAAQPPPAPIRYGRVEAIRETVHRQQGDPAAGAVAGAVIGGLLGSALGSHTVYDRWGYGYRATDPGATFAGAVGGAMVGAAASQAASGEDRVYEVFVRFEDGSLQTFAYRGGTPFSVGEAVSLTPQGLVRS